MYYCCENEDEDFVISDTRLNVCVTGNEAFAWHLMSLLNNAAEHSVQLTALRRGLAVSILFNVILLAVVSLIIGGN